MFTVYAAYRNSDTTEAMVLDRVFTKREDAEEYIGTKTSAMGRTPVWKVEEVVVYESRVEFLRTSRARIRAEALKKLTDEEREALGLEYPIVRQVVTVDGRWSYLWEGPEELKVGDQVVLPPNVVKRWEWVGTVTALEGTRYTGPLKTVIRKEEV